MTWARIALSTIGCGLFMVGCVRPTDGTAQTEIGVDGGTAATIDGGVNLVIPAGALEEPVMIGIAPVAGSESAMEFELTPDGLTFDTPVQLNIDVTDLAAADADGVRALPFLSTLNSDGSNPAVASEHMLTVDPDTGKATLTGEIDHFSSLHIDFMSVDVFVSSLPSSHPANTELDPVTIRLRITDDMVRMTGPKYLDLSEGELIYQSENPITLPDMNGADLVETTASYSCGEPGSGDYLATIDFVLAFQFEQNNSGLGAFNGRFGVIGEEPEPDPTFPYTVTASAFVQCQGEVADPVDDPPPGVDPDKLPGLYTGNGDCQIGSMTLGLTSEGNITAEPLGSENGGPITFAPLEGSDTTFGSVRTDLSFFGVVGHSCALVCGQNAVTVECTGPEGFCRETLTFQGS